VGSRPFIGLFCSRLGERHVVDGVDCGERYRQSYGHYCRKS
jgi:hypothetical protein